MGGDAVTAKDKAINKILKLVLVDMPAATNRDLAADGPVGGRGGGGLAVDRAGSQGAA